MADDDGGFSWDEVETIEEPKAEEAAAAPTEEATAGGEEKPPEPPKPRYIPQKDSDLQALHCPRYIKRDIKKGREFHHWVRPTTLQYKYNYDYAHNYYDDVIHYINNKTQNIPSELPRPQTWAERSLRTHTKGLNESAAYEKLKSDAELLSKIKHSSKFYADHSKEFYNRKYRDVLYAYITHW